MRAVSLMYHDVCDVPSASGFGGADADAYKISVHDFVQHLKILADAGCDFSRTVDRCDLPSEEIPLFMTFDDGGIGAMLAADLLEKQGWKGHFFVTTSRIESEGFLGRRNIVELDARGHLIGTHSHSHPLRMGSLQTHVITEEWQKSMQVLEDILSKRVTVASVPGGYFSKRVRDAAIASGIRTLFTSEPTVSISVSNDCKIVGRFVLNNRTPANTVLDLVSNNRFARERQLIIWNAKKPIKSIGGEVFLNFRRRFARFRTIK